MAGVKLSKKDFFKCLCKAFVRGFKRHIYFLKLYFKHSNPKILKHALATVVIMVILIGMAVPVSFAADDNFIQESSVQPPVTMADDGDTPVEELSVDEMYINDTVNYIGNDGYPYAKKSSEGVTFAVQVSSSISDATYQWQYSDDKEQWTNLKNGTEQVFENPSPTSGRWYRCLVNGEESKAVQVIGMFKCANESETDSLGRTWTSPHMPWYISNGYIAYGLSADGTSFDVAGLYEKAGKEYMIQTSYSSGWKMVTSNSDAPATDYEAAKLDDVLVSFSESNPYEIYIDADLAEGQTAFSFGCDTMLGNDVTSRAHADFAALEVNKKSDNTIDNITMVGAGSSSQAAGSNPGFVITPITCDDFEFWLGHYNERQFFSFNEGTGNITVNGEYIDNICTESLGIDAGMTMSWFNVPAGETISFMFSVGDAASIGVTTNSGNINYIGELIEGLKQDAVYKINVDGEDKTFIVRTNALGHITFKAVDNYGNRYDFAGKTLTITRLDNADEVINVKISPRPTAIQDIPDSDEVVSIGENSVTLSLPLGGLQLFAQEYRIYDEDGNEIEGFGWKRPLGDGTISFDGLESDTIYTIKARVFATSNSPVSLPSEGYRFRTN